eukprot:sb/3464362/
MSVRPFASRDHSLRKGFPQMVLSRISKMNCPPFPNTCTLGVLGFIQRRIQRWMSFDRPEKVGTVKELSILYTRGAKLTNVEEINVTPWDVKHNKRFALYRPDLSGRVTSISPAGAIETLRVTCSMSGHVLTASYPSLPDLVIDIQELESREADRITGVPTKHGLDGREYVRVSDEADAWFTKIMAPVVVEVERFRPNILVEGSVPCDEIEWKVVKVGEEVELEMAFVNPRCGTINALDGRYDPKIMNVLQKYGEHRDKNNKVCMGVFYRVLRPGVVRVGADVVVMKRVKEFMSGPDSYLTCSLSVSSHAGPNRQTMFSVGYDKFCVDHLGNENKGSGLSIGTYPCHNPESAIDNQFLMVTNDGIFRTIDRCLSLNRDDTVVLSHCYDYREADYQFKYNLQSNPPFTFVNESNSATCPYIFSCPTLCSILMFENCCQSIGLTGENCGQSIGLAASSNLFSSIQHALFTQHPPP